MSNTNFLTMDFVRKKGDNWVFIGKGGNLWIER
jgi:hypothetical protein